MTDRTGLGVVEISVLEALDELGARPELPYVKCARVLQLLTDEHGVSPRYGYDALCSLARPWLVHLPLVDFHGNLGSADEADRPANPRYTEARLSTAGALAIAAERATGPRLPIGLVNGDLHVDGSSPAFSPSRVVDTLLALLDDPEMPDGDLVQRVGPPAFPTGCRVECDGAALTAAAPTTLMLTARLTVEAGKRGPAIVVTNLPPGVGEQQISQARETHRLSEERLKNIPGTQAGEVLLALQGTGVAQLNYLSAVRDYDKAQLRLMLLLGPGAVIGCHAPVAEQQLPIEQRNGK